MAVASFCHNDRRCKPGRIKFQLARITLREDHTIYLVGALCVSKVTRPPSQVGDAEDSDMPVVAWVNFTFRFTIVYPPPWRSERYAILGLCLPYACPIVSHVKLHAKYRGWSMKEACVMMDSERRSFQLEKETIEELQLATQA
jgi:hypothetical protein